MIVYTVQPSELLKTFEIPKEPFRPDIKELYKKFFKLAGLNCEMAFWGWTRLQGVNLDSVNEEDILHYLYHGPQPHSWIGKVIIKLDIPDNEVVLSNYYEWSDIIFFTLEEPNEADAQISWNVLFDTNPQTSNGNTEEVQAVFKQIKPEWIVSTLFYTNGGE